MDSSLIIFYFIGIATVLLVSGAVYFFSHRRRYVLPRGLLWVLIVAPGYLFFAHYLKYKSLHFFSDFSHWLEVVRSIAVSGKPLSLSHEFIFPGTLNYFSAHFVPLIYVFGLIFKIFPFAGTLSILNIAVMLSSAIPLYLLAKRMQGSARFALRMAALLLWYPTFQYIIMYEFEMLRFSIPILLWMLYYFEVRRTILYLLFVVLAILVREEVGLTVAMFGLYALIFQRRWREGIVTIVLGLSGFALITGVIMPMFRIGEYTHIAAGVFSQFGSTPLEVVRGVVAHPLLAAQTMFNPIKLVNLFMLGLPLMFIPLATPAALIGAVANIGTGLLSDSLVHSSYMLYYIAPSLPFIFYAFIKAWPKVVRWLPSPQPSPKGGGGYGENPLPQGEGGRRPGEGALMNALLAATLTSHIFFGPSPISLQFWFQNIRPAPFRTQNFHWSAYRVTNHHRRVEEFTRRIPDDAIVATQEFLMPRLYKKKGTMKFPQLQTKDGKYRADYVFIDRTNNGLNPESPAHIGEQEIDAVVESGQWEQVAEEDGYALYYRLENYK